MEFTHLDKNGNAIMVDIGDKDITKRVAIACGSIRGSKDIISSIKNMDNKKGDVISTARIAGIMAVKNTSSVIPLCHNILINKAKIDFEIDEENLLIKSICTVHCTGKTGVEMEALHGVSVALLTIYDMCKAIDKSMVIFDIHLMEKTGGKSGDFKFEDKDK